MLSKQDSTVCPECGRKKMFGVTRLAGIGEDAFEVYVRRCNQCGHETWCGLSFDTSVTRVLALREEAERTESHGRALLDKAAAMRSTADRLEAEPVESFKARLPKRVGKLFSKKSATLAPMSDTNAEIIANLSQDNAPVTLLGPAQSVVRTTSGGVPRWTFVDGPHAVTMGRVILVDDFDLAVLRGVPSEQKKAGKANSGVQTFVIGISDDPIGSTNPRDWLNASAVILWDSAH